MKFKNQDESLNWIESNLYTSTGRINGPRATEKWCYANGFKEEWDQIQEIKKTYNFSSNEFLFRLRNKIPWNKKFYCETCGKEVGIAQTGIIRIWSCYHT